MAYQPAQAPWTRKGWLEEASSWIRSTLEQQNTSIIGPIQQEHIRPWSTVVRVPAKGGDVYFKAVTPVLANEPALVQALS
ncbi:MAG: hypothetical protein ACWGPS_09960, partial [Candidatus Promineifilaceae bacterium]